MSFRGFLISALLPFVTCLSGLVTFFYLSPSEVHGRELVDMSLEVTTLKKGAEAKQDAFDQATERATQQLTDEILGVERSARYWPNLRTKLLKNSTRYVLFIKGLPPQEGSVGGTRMTVQLRLSPDNLETIFREEGVLSTGGVRILPLVEVQDAKGARYMWWSDISEHAKNSPVQAAFKTFYTKLMGKFKSKNIFVLDPLTASFRLSVPAAFRGEDLRRDEQILFAQYLKADVVVSGKVFVNRNHSETTDLRLEYDLQVWQAKGGRAIGEVQRSEIITADTGKVIQALLEQTSPKVIEELAGRLSEALASGNINLNVVQIAVQGNMSYRQQAEFRRQLSQLREIRILKERLFEPRRVVFEAETPVNGPELAKALKKTRFPLYTVKVDNVQDNSLALSVEALSSSSAQ